MIKVGVIGATGYAGQQLVGLLSNHPKVHIEFLSSYSFAGRKFSDVYPIFSDIDLICIDLNEALTSLEIIDVLFIALPHGQSTKIIKGIENDSLKIIDLGADYRLEDHTVLYEWYGVVNNSKALKSAVYGLPELNKTKIAKSKMTANPGCYPTASLLGLLPILDNNLIDTSSIVIDAKSGVTGAGRKVNESLTYNEVNENFKAYGVAVHRHTPEIETVIGSQLEADIKVNFTPHLVPMQRGILATIYVNLLKSVDESEIKELYESYYEKAPFVRIITGLPETKHVARTNYCDIGFKLDKRTNRLIIVSVIDNLMKGAAGQAIQNLNIMMGLDEELGLKNHAYYL